MCQFLPASPPPQHTHLIERKTMENLPNLTYLLHKQQITDNDETNKQLPEPNMFTFHQHNTHGKP